MRFPGWRTAPDLYLGLLTGLAALVVYVRTLTPTVPFWDSGEFIATSHILGIPHPPGTPLYVVLGRVFSLAPVGSIAARVNFLSALPSAIAVFLTYLVTARILAGCGAPFASGEGNVPRPSALARVGAMVAGLVMAYSNTYWVNATEAEVYALSSMVMVGSVYGMLKWRDMHHAGGETARRASNVLILVFYVMALSIAFHMGVFIIFLPLALFLLSDFHRSLVDPRFILSAIVIVALSFVLGLERPQLLFSVIFTMILLLLNWETVGARNIVAVLLSGVFLVGSAALIRGLGPVAGLVVSLVIAATILWTAHKTLTHDNLGTWAAAVFILGLSIHLFLLIRAGLDPAINEADPRNLENFWLVLSRDQYKPPLPWDRRADLAAAFNTHFWRYWKDQYDMGVPVLRALPFVLGAWGAWVNASRSPRYFVLMAFIVFVTSIGLIWHLNFKADEVRDRDYFFVALFHFFAIWIGMGVAGVLHLVRDAVSPGPVRRAAVIGTAGLAFLMPIGQVRAGWFTHDRSGFWVAREYAYNLLQPLERNAILFTNGDNDTFPLWYLQEVEYIRKDVRVANLSLLNTDWYIRQLKDLDPKVPITWTHEEIRSLRNMPPFQAEDGRIWTIKDVAVDHIVRAAGDRPLYIAVTVPDLMGYDQEGRLTMEGLAWRLQPEPTKVKVDQEKLRRNLEEVFSWRGLFDENGELDKSVYRDDNAMKLVQNYSAAYFRLSEGYRDEARRLKAAGRVAEAEATMEKAIKALDRMTLLRDDPSVAELYIGGLYRSMGMYTKADSIFTQLLDSMKQSTDPAELEYLPDIYLGRGEARLALEDFEGARADFQEFVQVLPQYWEGWEGLAMAYQGLGQRGQALAVVDEWLKVHAQHAPAVELRESILHGDSARSAVP